MTDRSKPGLDVNALMRRVRAEAEPRRGEKDEVERRPNLYLDASGGPRSTSTRIPEQSSYVLAELLPHEEEDFVRNAYLAVLGRPPDAEGRRHYVDALLHGGLDRVEVLARLRYSPEGRARGVRIRGLRIAASYRLLRRIPIIGYVAAWINHFLRLPNLARTSAHLDLRIRTRIGHAEARIRDAEFRLERLTAQVDALESHSERISALAVLASELSEAALSRADGDREHEDGPG